MGVYVGDKLVAGNVGEVYSKAQVDAMIANAVALAEPTGSIKPFAGTTIPDGYLLCDGSAVSRTTYADLFAAIGTTYGPGDGNSTFNLPDMNYAIPMWRNDPTAYGSRWQGSIPNITGYISAHVRTKINGTATGAFYIDSTGNAYSGNYWEGGQGNLGFDASRVNGVYDPNNTGQVYACNRKMYYVIKY